MLERWPHGLNICAVWMFALLNAGHASAQEDGPTLLSYHGPDGCSAVADFERSVHSRSARVRFVEQGPHDREISISLRKEGGFTHGELRLTERDGSVRQRNVRFTTCSEAVEGLAIIAVLSLDPQALLQSAKSAEPAAVPAPAPEPAPTPVPPQAKIPSKSDAVPARSQSEVEWALGAEFNAAFSALPAPALGGSLFVDVGSLGVRPNSGLAPLFRGAISHVERRGLESGAAEANFTLTLVTISACPVRLVAGFLMLRPCVFGSGGALHTWGSQTTNPQQRTRPYGAIGGSVFALARVSQAVDIVADLALGATLLRDSFGFDQAQTWQTPALYLSSGVGARFVFR